MNLRNKHSIRAIKGRGFYSKNIFWTHALWGVWPKFVHAQVVKIDKIHLNVLILGHFKGYGYNSRATFNGAGAVTDFLWNSASQSVTLLTLNFKDGALLVSVGF